MFMAPRTLRKSLQVERLEDRQVLAGNVAVVVQGETLVITGDAADNAITLTYNSLTQRFAVRGREAGGSPTLVNGQDTAPPANAPEFAGVRQINISMQGGHDSVEIGSPQAVDTVLSRWLSIDMGEGNDEVIAGRAGNAPGGAAPTAVSLRTGGSLIVNLGPGNDVLQVANADIGQNLTVVAGDGDDDVTFATEFTPGGATRPNRFPVRIRGSISLNLGGGEDEAVLRNGVIDGQVVIQDDAGKAHLNLFNLNIQKKLDIDTGHEADTITLDYVNARQFTIDSNGGVDDVDVTNGRYRTMTLKLGGSRDDLKLQNVRVSAMTHLDGGSGSSSLVRGPGNQLRGLTKRRIG
jgi:hypothetical protein